MFYFASGDSGFYFSEQLKSLSWLPVLWRDDVNLGVLTLSRMWFDYPFLFSIKALSSIGLSWAVIEKLLWILLLLLSIYSLNRLTRIFLKSFWQKIIASIVFCTNTYILLLFGGGQIGVAAGYAFAPFVLARFIQSTEQIIAETYSWKRTLRESLITGLSLSLLIAFDLRFTYLIVMAAFLYIVTRLLQSKKVLLKVCIKIIAYVFIITGCIAILIHAYWILPIIKTGWGTSELGDQYTGFNILKDLSFADFAHSISLLHPNWPDNLFGRVYFFQPEFLVLPIIAFSSLFFSIGKSDKKYLLYFATLGLFGAFFAKGVKPPFEVFYLLSHKYIPGFVMFRDPTKFYVFTAIAYSMLIPYALGKIVHHVKRFKYIPYIMFLIIWGVLVRQLVAGELKGQFRMKEIPSEYVALKDVLVQDANPYRTLWLPITEKFAYASSIHPAIYASTLFQNAPIDVLTQLIQREDFQQTIGQYGIKYLIVPQDVEQRIFMNDYKYDDTQRQQLITALANAGFKRDDRFSDIAVFINDDYLFEQYPPTNLPVQIFWSTIGLIIGIFVLILCYVLIIIL